jgi:hypothetical protein
MYVQFGNGGQQRQGYKVTSVGTTSFVISAGAGGERRRQRERHDPGLGEQRDSWARWPSSRTASFMTTLGISTTVYNGIDR